MQREMLEATEWYQTPVEPAAGAETILFVEDEAFVRDVTREVLRAAGYKVLAAQNAVDAVREYEQCCGSTDLLLTDVVLPGDSGRVLAGKLRKSNPELKILFVSGYAEQMGLRDGSDEECLAKPFSTGALLRRVRRVLDGEGPVKAGEDEIKRAGGSV